MLRIISFTASKRTEHVIVNGLVDVAANDSNHLQEMPASVISQTDSSDVTKYLTRIRCRIKVTRLLLLTDNINIKSKDKNKSSHNQFASTELHILHYSHYL